MKKKLQSLNIYMIILIAKNDCIDQNGRDSSFKKMIEQRKRVEG